MQNLKLLKNIEIACRAKEISDRDDYQQHIDNISIGTLIISKNKAFGMDNALKPVVLMYANKITEIVFGTPEWGNLKFKINKGSIAGFSCASIPTVESELMKILVLKLAVDKLSDLNEVGLLDFTKGVKLTEKWVLSMKLDEGEYFNVSQIKTIIPYHLSSIPNAFEQTMSTAGFGVRS